MMYIVDAWRRSTPEQGLGSTGLSAQCFMLTASIFTIVTDISVKSMKRLIAECFVRIIKH